MSNANRGTGPEYRAQDAKLSHAGAAQSLPGPDEPAPQGETGAKKPKPPTAKQLDAREKKFTQRPRKPMGPTPDQAPETVPDE
ncbi:hypothetical protein NRK68_09140 [Streptomyces yangpuensis]|uniref:Uncharacterized protein n=1 Tax=Streptomyces yangpuensis TaxID=1648182 RepID=A0ABY5PUB3_9ACTN|nr:hypothetical protein [Streptomyces yangpuensis]UUY47368.1 hypothetical protein NRK68_09140 [Streptomyces yangpuensis]